jgi:hypothetical protein
VTIPCTAFTITNIIAAESSTNPAIVHTPPATKSRCNSWTGLPCGQFWWKILAREIIFTADHSPRTILPIISAASGTRFDLLQDFIEKNVSIT